MTDASLIYSVGADTSKFDASMAKLKTTTKDSSGQMLFAFQTSARGIIESMTSIEASVIRTNTAVTQAASATNTYGESLKGVSSVIEAVTFGLAAIDASKNIISRLSAALGDAQGRVEKLLQIAAGSQATGVGTTFLQSLVAQAKDLGIEASAVTGILNHAREAAIVRQGEGPAGTVNASAFQDRLGEQVRAGNLTAADRAPYDTATATGTQEERIRAVLDLMDKLEAANKHLAAQDLGKSFFGDSFETLANQGIDLVEALRKAAAGLDGKGGRIASQEEVDRATDLKKRVEEINNIYDGTLKQALTDIAYLQDFAAQKSLEWQKYVADVASNFKGIYDYVRQTVLEAVKFGQSLGIIGENFGKIVKPGQGAEPKASASDAPAVSAAGDSDGGGESGPLILHIGDRSGRRRGQPLKRDDQTRPIITPKSDSDSEEPDAVEQFIRLLNKARDVQVAELATVGKTVVERERLLALARAEAAARDDFEKGRRTSPKLDDDERTRAIAAADAYGRAKAATMDLEQKQRQAAETARYFGQALTDAFADAVIDGRNFGEVVSGLIKQLERAALQAAFLGQGRIGGVFGFKPKAEEVPGVCDQRVPVSGRRSGVDGRGALPRERDDDGEGAEGRGVAAPERGSSRAGAEPVSAADDASARDRVRDLRRAGGRLGAGGADRVRAA